MQKSVTSKGRRINTYLFTISLVTLIVPLAACEKNKKPSSSHANLSLTEDRSSSFFPSSTSPFSWNWRFNCLTATTVSDSKVTAKKCAKANLSYLDAGSQPAATSYRVDLTDSDFKGANLSHANLASATLTNADFSSFSDKDGVKVVSNLNAINLDGANLENTKFNNATAQGAVFTFANIVNADFANVDFSLNREDPNSPLATTFSYAIIEGSTFECANLSQVSFATPPNSTISTQIQNTTFSCNSNANYSIKNTDFAYAVLEQVTFGRKVILSNSSFNNTTFNGVTLEDNVDLSDVDLSHVILGPDGLIINQKVKCNSATKFPSQYNSNGKCR